MAVAVAAIRRGVAELPARDAALVGVVGAVRVAAQHAAAVDAVVLGARRHVEESTVALLAHVELAVVAGAGRFTHAEVVEATRRAPDHPNVVAEAHARCLAERLTVALLGLFEDPVAAR